MESEDGRLADFAPLKSPELLHPLVLAYIGDGVMDLYVRQYLVSQSAQKPHQLHRGASRIVSAKAQARALQHLMPELTDEEKDIVRRGRNAKSGTIPKNADVLDYRHATALEALIGYLYYRGAAGRIRELLDAAIKLNSRQSNGG